MSEMWTEVSSTIPHLL